MVDVHDYIKKYYLKKYELATFDLNSNSKIKVVEGLENISVEFTDHHTIRVVSNNWTNFSAYIIFYFVYNDLDNGTLNDYLNIINDIDNNDYKEYPISKETYDTFILSSLHLISPYKPDFWYINN